MSQASRSIVIRNYRAGDMSAVVKLCRELLSVEVGLFDRMLEPLSIGPWFVDRLLAECEKLDGSLLVAADGDELLGFATIFTDVQSENVDEKNYIYAYLGHLLVTKHARGRGIGKLLIDECEILARRAGREWMQISVLAGNTEAHRLYNSLGYANHLVTMEKPLG